MSERGPAGATGEGTPGKRLKNKRPASSPLRTFARAAARDAKHDSHHDAVAWLEKKHIRFRDA